VNRFDRNNPADHELDKMLRQTLGEKVMTTMIPNSRTIKNSINYRQTAIEYMWWIPATKAYNALTHEILRICGEEVE
jgi:chromosome partitioning protein